MVIWTSSYSSYRTPPVRSGVAIQTCHTSPGLGATSTTYYRIRTPRVYGWRFKTSDTDRSWYVTPGDNVVCTHHRYGR